MPHGNKGRKWRKAKKYEDFVLPRERCCFCTVELNTVHVKCGECEDVILCLKCFSSGAELGSHQKTHKYGFLYPLESISLFKTQSTRWEAVHELKLLHAIGRYGYGNWALIAQEISEDYLAEDVRKHYEDVYVKGPIGEALWRIEDTLTALDHTFGRNDPLLPGATSFRDQVVLPAQQKELGYMPLRDEYEIEYDDDAELLISQMSYSLHEDEVETGLKLAMLSIYNERLRKRFHLKKIARDYNKVEEFFKFGCRQKAKPSRPKLLTGNFQSYQDFKEQMLVFARFFNEPQFHSFYESLQKEKKLKSRIRSLIRMRRLGFTCFEDARQAGLLKSRGRKKSESNSSFLKPSSSSQENKKEVWRCDNNYEHHNENQREQNKTYHSRLKDLLTAQERKLCITLDLLPREYVTLKACILKLLYEVSTRSTLQAFIKDFFPDSQQQHSNVDNMEFQRQRGEEITFTFPPGLTRMHYSEIITYMGKSGWLNFPYTSEGSKKYAMINATNDICYDFPQNC